MPLRTCVGCRQTEDQARLVRLAATASGVQVSRTAPGRGAWLHPGAGCGESALRRRAVGRALRTIPDAAQLAAVLSQVDAQVPAWAIRPPTD